MKATGIVRKIDALGRVVIPIELRKSYGLDVGTPIEILSGDEGLLMRPFNFGGSQQLVKRELSVMSNFVEDPEKLKAIDIVLDLYKEIEKD
ncbi:AbrB/MazE/SpoVT family DNA-binding domain-containing protein [Priestia megaterium]|uniref:AbrB/MazE/SpoVT family DNA-binding domain-containing protein n=1 Tax=Priestia megaterium TaxID=1404 RepID=UPI002E202232|nr:AbrB/MazE/SpoVT family DNA-binding domain-containing protein [Priestia megaterium]MED4102177.1 AbrB/MazE/SpoVT family DNA-binding domain-containing protein [Priestia megaterium]MED4142604.1 AbrB/MazE/SpoVT family DNA-binding domain-containing protein [Priestia megaterium]